MTCTSATLRVNLEALQDQGSGSALEEHLTLYV